jgi:hypothetical protein
MKQRIVSVTIFVEVDDAREVIRAARDHAVANGGRRSDVTCVRDAVHMLLDPGISPPGLSILDSTVEGP